MLKIVINRHIPGGSHIHGLEDITETDCAAYNIFPQDASGTCTPIPKKLSPDSVPYTHPRAHETLLDHVCRLLLEQKKWPQK